MIWTVLKWCYYIPAGVFLLLFFMAVGDGNLYLSGVA